MNSNQLIRMVVRMLMTFGVTAFVNKSRAKDHERNPEEVAQARKSEQRVRQSSRIMRRFGRF